MFAFIFAGSEIRFKAHSGDTLQLDVRHRMVMASVLSSTDTVAPMAFLPADVFPRLYAVVFGEGVLNDVVSILLSTAAASSDGASAALALNIVVLFLASGVMGVAFGLGMSFLFRQVEWFQTGEPLKPCVLLVLGNYACYMVVEMWSLSSIFALFVSALICGHYAKHSLADKGAFASELAELLAYVAEAFVFGYFGITSVGYLQDPKTVSPSLICFYIGCIFMSRVVAVAMLAVPLRCCWYRRGSAVLPKRELCVVALAGCMRGTIAFALVLRATPAPEMQLPEDRLLITTVLGIVMVNAIVFGALFPVAMQLLGLVPLADAPQGAVESEGDRPESGVHRRWKRLDNMYLKPLFRKPEPPGSNHRDDAMAETLVPRRQQLWPMARQQSGESEPAAASERSCRF
jgi:sodium/hydrogen exchanger-like protein 6/7/sodium/hydrogen exchanger 8